jgi:hypothetical protein
MYLFINSNNRTIYPKEGNKYTVWKYRVSEHNQGHSSEYCLHTLCIGYSFSEQIQT